jgi:ADP-heptose:LPS heptosyltransferase
MKTWCGVMRIGGIGDNLMAASVLPLLKKKYDCIEVLTKEPNHVVFGNNPYIDKMSITPEDEEPEDAVTWQRKLGVKAREYGKDAFFNLSHSCETALVFLEGQTDFHRPAAVRRWLCDDSYLGRVHDLCMVPRTYSRLFFPTEAEIRKALETRDAIRAKRPGPIIAWCLTGSRLDKAYPYSHYVIARLISELGAHVIQFGSPSRKDWPMAKQIEEEVLMTRSTPDGLHTAITDTTRENGPDWPIRRILAQMAMCDLVVGPDTGPLWSVAMEDVPKIVLLSHASERNVVEGWRNTVALHADPARVDCWPCHRLHDTFATCRKAKGVDVAACMADIPVQAVMDAAISALTKSCAAR